MSCEVFVGNLPSSADREEIRALLGKAGEVQHVNLSKKKGKPVAFVRFKDASTATAVVTRQNSEPFVMEGQTLLLKVADPNKKGDGDAGDDSKKQKGKKAETPAHTAAKAAPEASEEQAQAKPGHKKRNNKGPAGDAESKRPKKVEKKEDEVPENTMFVGGMAKDIDEEKLKASFQPLGTVLSARVVMDPKSKLSRGIGFVTFASSEVFDKLVAKGKANIGGKDVEVKAALSKAAVSKKQSKAAARPKLGETTVNRVFVGGLPSDATKLEVRNYFNRAYCKTQGVEVPEDGDAGKEDAEEDEGDEGEDEQKKGEKGKGKDTVKKPLKQLRTPLGNVVAEVELKADDDKKCRGFGFVTFKTKEAYDAILECDFKHSMRSKKILTVGPAKDKLSKDSHYNKRVKKEKGGPVVSSEEGIGQPAPKKQKPAHKPNKPQAQKAVPNDGTQKKKRNGSEKRKSKKDGAAAATGPAANVQV